MSYKTVIGIVYMLSSNKTRIGVFARGQTLGISPNGLQAGHYYYYYYYAVLPLHVA